MNIGLYGDTKNPNWKPNYSLALKDRGKIRLNFEWLWFTFGLNTF